MTELLYMSDIESNYIKEFDAEVLVTGNDHIILNRSAFYPKGGGQPSDTGILRWDDNESKVTKVEKKGKIIHRINGDLPPEGTIVTGHLDWGRRYEHMKLHTAQHLFSAVVFDMFKGRTVGNQIYTDYSRVDFEPVSFSKDDLDLIEEEVNHLINQAIPVEIYEENRKVIEEDFDTGRVDFSLLPDSITKLRIVDIGGYDICPCAGTHVRNTEEIEKVNITKNENKGKDRERLYYEIR
ncbi:MAG: alanyl-tRNA editing protein [Thermoplasmatota archaeon]